MRLLQHAGLQPSRGHGLHLAAEHLLQILCELDQVEQAAARFQFDQEIQVAARAILAARGADPNNSIDFAPCALASVRISACLPSTSA